MNSKINRELSELVQEKVISQEVSQNISQYYAAKTLVAAKGPNKLFAIFGVLGSLLVGLGLILILAHNWDDFSRATKTIWAFIPMIIGQIAVGYCIFKKKSAAWKESAATFLFFAIGSSIALVSQIYNIAGSMPSFLLSWIILAAPLIYLLRSHAATVLHLIFITAYACNVGYFDNASPWLYIPLFAWVIPHYYVQLKNQPNHNLTGLFHWLLPVSVIISLGGFVVGNENTGFLMYVVFFGLLYNLGKLPFFTHKKMRVNGYLLLGSVGTIFVLMLASFSWIWDGYSPIAVDIQEALVTVVLALVAIGVLVYLFQKKRLMPFNLFQYAFLIFGAIYFFKFTGSEIPMILTNLLLLALGVFAIAIGARKNRFSILNYGLLIITVLVACRFFDSDISFVLRGLLFVAIGAGFFATNYWMFKKQQKQQDQQLKITSHE